MSKIYVRNHTNHCKNIPIDFSSNCFNMLNYLKELYIHILFQWAPLARKDFFWKINLKNWFLICKTKGIQNISPKLLYGKMASYFLQSINFYLGKHRTISIKFILLPSIVNLLVLVQVLVKLYAKLH